mgnify:CR=1 FL=1
MALAGFLDTDLTRALKGLGFYNIKLDNKNNSIALSCKVVVFDLLKDNADFLQDLYNYHGLNKQQTLNVLYALGIYHFDSTTTGDFEYFTTTVNINTDTFYKVVNYTTHYIDGVLQNFIDILNAFKERTEVYQ